jgi:uncharacterized protein
MTTTLHVIPARKSAHHRLAAGERIKVINTHGSQIVDCWAFCLPDTAEFMSMEHSRVELGRAVPRVGDSLVTNRRRPILTLVEDSSPGVHDTTLAACDVYRYQRLGAKGYHDNCTDNLAAAMKDARLKLPETPCPFNIWQNSRTRPDFSLVIEPPVSKPGDHVVLRAELDCEIVFSTCPQDMVPANGVACKPTEAHFAVL